MNALLIAIFAAIALFAASALVIFSLAGERSPAQSRLSEMAALAMDTGGEPVENRIENIFSLVTRPLAPLRNWLLANDEKLTTRLRLAGYRRPQDAEIFLSLKVLAPVVGILLATFAGPDNIIFAVLILGAISFFAPDIFLFRAIKRRRAKIGLALPDALDLLVICMEAGLGMDQASLRVAQELGPAAPQLSDELMMIAHEQRAGKPRLEAWRSMAERVDLDMIRQFVAMLVQTERLGTPIARALSQFADGLRAKRLLAAEENAAKTAIKLIFPLVLFIFPPIFVVLLGPSAIAIRQGFEQIAR